MKQIKVEHSSVVNTDGRVYLHIKIGNHCSLWVTIAEFPYKQVI